MKVKQQQESTMNYKIKGCSILEIHTTKCKYDESYTTKQMYVQGLKLCTTKQVQCTLESYTTKWKYARNCFIVSKLCGEYLMIKSLHCSWWKGELPIKLFP